MRSPVLPSVAGLALAAAVLAPAAVHAQASPAGATPQAGWQVAPPPSGGLAGLRQVGPDAYAATPRPPSPGAYAPPPCPPPAQPAPPYVPPHEEPRSTGAIIGGTVLATVGLLPFFAGIGILASDGSGGYGFGETDQGWLLLGGGALMMGGGVALIVWGSEDRWVLGKTASAKPVVRVGPTSASARWAF
jgi:hypothetical protein